MRARERTPLREVDWYSDLVRVAEEETRKARDQRDDAIRAAHKKGETVADIAAAAELPASSIYAIIQPKQCAEEGCDRQVTAAGLCNMHYTRLIRARAKGV